MIVPISRINVEYRFFKTFCEDGDFYFWFCKLTKLNVIIAQVAPLQGKY